MITITEKCPVCDGATTRVEVPRQHIRVCGDCNQIVQVLPDGTLSPLSNMLERNALGDDRVRAAITVPHVTTVRSFMEIFEQAARTFNLTMAQAVGELRPVLSQIENRIDAALSVFSGFDLVDDRAGEGLAALREARELVSIGVARTRGVLQEKGSAESA